MAKVRRIPIALQGKVELELDRLLQQGIITPVEASEWLAPVVVASKPNGDIRLVVVDKFLLPNIDEIMSTLSGAKFFTTLDLTQAYHQIELAQDSQDLTAFITPMGAFQYKRMPFGLVSAASVFQRVMSSILKGVKGVKCYQDDLLIFGLNQHEHDKLETDFGKARKSWSPIEIRKVHVLCSGSKLLGSSHYCLRCCS